MQTKIIMDGLLEVCSDGMVYKIMQDGAKKPTITNTRVNGRIRKVVSSYENKVQKAYQVSRLVAEAFIPNLENKPLVLHKNGDSEDNRVENLQWVNNKELVLRSVKQKQAPCLICGEVTCAKDRVCTSCKQKEKLKRWSVESKERYIEDIDQKLEHIDFSLLTRYESEAVILRQQHLSYEEIGLSLGCTRQCAQQRIRNAIKKSTVGPKPKKTKLKQATTMKNKLAVLYCKKKCIENDLEEIQDSIRFLEQSIAYEETPGAATPRESRY